jgi:hypothetical protein
LKAVPTRAPSPLTAASFFTDGKSWTENGGWWVHNLSGYTFLRATQGAFVFNILKESQKGILKRGVKKISFVADYQDPDDRVAYTLDARNLVRKVFTGGHGGDEKKTPHAMENGPYYVLKVEITPEAVAIKNGSGALLDSIKRSGPSSKFGFQDEVELIVR